MEIKEDPKKTQDSGTPTEPIKEENKGGEPKTFSQEEHQKELDRVLSERLAKEKEKTEKLISEKLQKEREAWEQESKLSQEEKEKKLEEKRKLELEEWQRNLTIRENNLEANKLLTALDIPIDFSEYLIDLDKEKMTEKINNFAKRWEEALSARVAKVTKGEPPIDPSKNSNNGSNNAAELVGGTYL